MRFVWTYTLSTLGNPPKTFLVREAFWWADGEAARRAATEALERCARSGAAAELREMLRDPKRAGKKNEPKDRTSSQD